MNAATLALLLICQVGVDSTHPSVRPTYTVHLLVAEKPVTGPGRVLADPLIAVVAGSVAKFQVGEPIHFNSEDIPFGTSAKFRIDPVQNGEVKLSGKIEVAIAKRPDKEIATCEQTSIHFAKTLTLGKKTHIQISKTKEVEKWIEIQVDAGQKIAQPSPFIGDLRAAPMVVR